MFLLCKWWFSIVPINQNIKQRGGWEKIHVHGGYSNSGGYSKGVWAQIYRNEMNQMSIHIFLYAVHSEYTSRWCLLYHYKSNNAATPCKYLMGMKKETAFGDELLMYTRLNKHNKIGNNGMQVDWIYAKEWNTTT